MAFKVKSFLFCFLVLTFSKVNTKIPGKSYIQQKNSTQTPYVDTNVSIKHSSARTCTMYYFDKGSY